MNEEFVFNIWFIVDIGTNLSTHCFIRPYYLSGGDDDKTVILNNLAETDYKCCNRIHYSEHIDTVYGNGQIVKGSLYLSSINSHFENDIEFFIRETEKQLPLLFRFEGDGKGKNETLKQSLPQSPLYVKTMLFENEYGEMRPYTTKENIAWIELERIRLNVYYNK